MQRKLDLIIYGITMMFIGYWIGMTISFPERETREALTPMVEVITTNPVIM